MRIVVQPNRSLSPVLTRKNLVTINFSLVQMGSAVFLLLYEKSARSRTMKNTRFLSSPGARALKPSETAVYFYPKLHTVIQPTFSFSIRWATCLSHHKRHRLAGRVSTEHNFLPCATVRSDLDS